MKKSRPCYDIAFLAAHRQQASPRPARARPARLCPLWYGKPIAEPVRRALNRPGLAGLIALLCLTTAPAPAAPELCENAARRAASESGVPVDVLLAIALTETGRRIDGQLRPWPWAANADGRGHWFDTAEQATRFARQRLAQGRPSFDLGCFQINWRWHGQHFDRPEALLDPLMSARYAARFLAGLYAETGDWTLAAGAYHSRTPHLAQRYRDRFARLRAALADDAGAPATARQPVAPHQAPTIAETSRPRMARPIRYALLSPGAPAPEGASLVPQGAPAPHRAGHHPATPAGGGGIATPAATGTAFLPGLPAAQDITP